MTWTGRARRRRRSAATLTWSIALPLPGRGTPQTLRLCTRRSFSATSAATPTINCAKKLHAAPWRRRTEPLSETLEAPSPEGEALWEELRRLPDKYRTVLHLYYYEDMTTEEIARLLDRSPATVRSQLMRGRDRLRVLLEEG